MAKKIYVGNLPFSTTKEDLVELFSQYGQVQDAVVISDKFSGRSRGFGFVELSSDEEAKKAIDALNGSSIEERNIVVNEAKPPKQHENSGYQDRR